MVMNKIEYMEELKKHLRRLPKEDFDKAIDYFEEYFADAGVENEAQVIEDLGSPDFAAKEIITTIAIKNTEEPTKDVKKGLNAVWVGILAICAAPIALPLAFVFGLVFILIIFCILLLFACLLLAGVLLTIMGPFSIVAAFMVLTSSVPVFISCIGIGLASTGLGLLIIYGMVLVIQSFLSATIRFFGRIIENRRKKNEQK